MAVGAPTISAALAQAIASAIVALTATALNNRPILTE